MIELMTPVAVFDNLTLLGSSSQGASLYPFLILMVGLIVVIGGIVALKQNAFISLIAAAIIVSLMAPGPWGEKMARVLQGFGDTAKGVGVVIALASIIGMAMVESGAADRIVRKLLALFGEKQASTALMTGGFMLAMPVFFDTVFYLMVPLARGLYQKLGKNYLKFLLAIDALRVSVGMMMLVGCMVGFPAAIAGMMFASFADSRMPNLKPPVGENEDQLESIEPVSEDQLPSLWLALLPIILPVLLISFASFFHEVPRGENGQKLPDNSLMGFIGSPAFALFLATLIAVWTYWVYRKPSVKLLSSNVEQAAISAQFGDSTATGIGLLLLSFGVAALVKFAQGSSTTALIVTSSMIAAIVYPDMADGSIVAAAAKSKELGYHPVYLAAAVGAGSLVGSWMNDSGFWIFTKMGGLTETEGLQTWSPLLAILGIVAMLMTLLLANVLPMVSA